MTEQKTADDPIEEHEVTSTGVILDGPSDPPIATFSEMMGHSFGGPSEGGDVQAITGRVATYRFVYGPDDEAFLHNCAIRFVVPGGPEDPTHFELWLSGDDMDALCRLWEEARPRNVELLRSGNYRVMQKE